MKCVRCGLTIRGDVNEYICDDCTKFSKVVLNIFQDVHNHLENTKSIDPDTNKLLQLLSDSTFVTSKNPQTAIFYKISNYIVSQAFSGRLEISEDELNRNVVTTRSWSDALKIFEELNLIRIRFERYERIIMLTEKSSKFAMQYLSATTLSEIGVRKRLAHIYAGYVLLYILSKVAILSPGLSNRSSLPYNQIPRTQWVTLMFLWMKAYEKNELFGEEEFRKFVSRRRIPSATRGKIINALQAMDGRSTQGMIKNINFDKGERKFTFEDYVLIEMDRIREVVRERER